MSISAFKKQIIFKFGQGLYVMTISMASMTIFFGCLYWYSLYSSEPALKDISRIVFYIFAAIVTVECGTFWIRNWIKAWRSKPSSKNTEWLEATIFNNELSGLAQKMGVQLNEHKQLGIVKDFGDARFTSKGQLLVGKKLWDVLTERARLALAAHEFAHSEKKHEDRFKILSIVSLMITLIVTYVAPLVAMIIFTVTLMPPQAVIIIFPVPAFCIASLIVSYQNEYEADLVAVEFSDGESVMYLIEHLGLREKRSLQTLSHPSVNNRRQNILKWNQANTNRHLTRCP